MPHDSSQSH